MDDSERVIRRIVLTGASGFIGKHLQQALVAGGYQVSAVVRPGSRNLKLIDPAVAIFSAELSDSAAITRALKGADLVIHCAGAVRGRTPADFAPANSDGVRVIAEAALQSLSRPRLLLISSLAASRPQLSDYAASKRAGEDAATAVPGLEWVIVRPPAVYGPGDREMRGLFVAIRWGLGVIPGPSGQRLSLLYVADLVRAIVAIVEHFAKCRYQVFDLDDGQPGGYGWSEIIDAARGSPAVLQLRIPRSVLALLARLNLLAAGVTGYAPMLTPGKVRELSESSWLCNNSRLTGTTGWMPRTKLREGLRSTFQTSAARESDTG